MKSYNDFLDTFRSYPKTGEQCVLCGSKKVDSQDFSDRLSEKEFQISGMCQTCQDKVFTDPEESEQ